MSNQLQHKYAAWVAICLYSIPAELAQLALSTHNFVVKGYSILVYSFLFYVNYCLAILSLSV